MASATKLKYGNVKANDDGFLRYRSDLHPLRRDVSRRESGDGRRNVDDVPASAGRPMAFSISATTWIACRLHGRIDRSHERPRNHWRYEELLPLKPSAVRHDWPVGYTPIIDSDAAGAAVGSASNCLFKDEGRNPTGFVQGSSQFGRRCTRIAGRRENDCLCFDRQRGEQPGRACGIGRDAGDDFCAADCAGAEGCPIASFRGDGVCREGFVRCGVRSVLEGLPRVWLVQSQLRDQSGACRGQENGRAGSRRAMPTRWASCPTGSR